jgi:hypothetical protein
LRSIAFDLLKNQKYFKIEMISLIAVAVQDLIKLKMNIIIDMCQLQINLYCEMLEMQKVQIKGKNMNLLVYCKAK